MTTKDDAWKRFYDSVYGEEDKLFQRTPHAHIQWKGTDACVDLHCICGSHGHIDADFLYNYRCAACGRCYALGTNVQLIRLNTEQVKFIEAGGACGFQTDESVNVKEDER